VFSVGWKPIASGKPKLVVVARIQRKHTAQGIHSIHPFINPPILLAHTLPPQKLTIVAKKHKYKCFPYWKHNF
jgi:hypothetical protein